MFAEKRLIQKTGSPAENTSGNPSNKPKSSKAQAPEALPQAIILKDTRAGIQKDTAEDLTKKPFGTPKAIIENIFSVDLQKLANAVGDKYALLNALLQSRLNSKAIYNGCSLALDGDIILEWTNEQGQTTKESLKNWYKIATTQLTPLLSKKLQKEIPENKALAELGLTQEDAEFVKKSGKKLPEIKDSLNRLRQAGITSNFGEFIYEYNQGWIDSITSPYGTIPTSIKVGLTDSKKILEFLKTPNFGDKLYKIADYNLILKNIDFDDQKIKNLLNTSNDPEKDLQALLKSEYIKYLKANGLPEDAATKIFETTNITEPKKILELINKVRAYGISKEEETAYILDLAWTYIRTSNKLPNRDLYTKLEVIKTCQKLALSLDETEKILRTKWLLTYTPQLLEILVKQGVRTHLSDFCNVDSANKLYTYGNLEKISKLKNYDSSMLDRNIYELLDKWRYVDDVLIVLNAIDSAAGKSSFLKTEIIDIASTEFASFNDIPTVVTYFKRLKAIGLYSPEIKALYKIDSNPAEVISFFKAIREKDKAVPTSKIIEIFKYTKDPTTALDILNAKNPNNTPMERLAKIGAAGKYPFTPRETQLVVDYLSADDIKKVGENLETYRYLNFFTTYCKSQNTNFAKYVFNLIDGLTALKIPKEEISDIWNYDKDPVNILRIRAWDKQFDFGMKRNYQEQQTERAQAVLFLMSQNPSQELTKLAAYVFRKTNSLKIRNIESFLKEPALKLCEKCMAFTADPALAFKIGRNLYLEGYPANTGVSQEIFAQKVEELKNLQNRLSKIALWEGCNVLLTCHNEVWANGNSRFDRKNLEYRLKESVGKNDWPPKGNFEKIYPKNNSTEEELTKHRQNLCEKIATTNCPLRFVFNGHGLENGLYFQNGSAVQLTPEDLAVAICRRKNNPNHKPADLANDVYVLDSCFNHNFLRTTLSEIRKRNGIIPIFIGESEFGQLGFDNDGNMGEMEESALGVGQRNVTLAYPLEHEKDWKSGDLCVYMPNAQGVAQEVVEKEKSDKTHRPA